MGGFFLVGYSLMNHGIWMEWLTTGRRGFLVVESWLVAFFVTGMSIGCILVPLAMRADSTSEHTDIGSFFFFTVLLFVACLEFCSVYWTWKCIAKKLYPVGFATAFFQPKWKWGLRYPISCWWASKFLSGVMLLFMFHLGVLHEGETDRPPEFWKSLVMVLIMAHLTFGNLMLALGCFVSRERLASIWKQRFLIEVCVAGSASAIKFAASQGH